MNKKIATKNIVSSIMLQVVNMISGFIVPRIILSTFGSEVNGLVSSLNQFLGYISLFEGGITGVVTASMYEPIVRHDQYRISRNIKTADLFFRKIAVIFFMYTIVLSIVYPMVVDIEVSFGYVCLLVWVMCISLFVQYFFSLSMKVLLNADKKIYVVCTTQAVIVILNTLLTIIISRICSSIHLIRLCSSCLYILQPVIWNYYVKKSFCIDGTVAPDPGIIAQRWDGFGINMAAFIHNNTDVVVLTLLASLKEVSVYSVYFLVVTGLKSLIVSVSSAMAPNIGQAYAGEDIEELRDKFRKYEFTILYLTHIVFTVGGLCITPFVQLYTRNIHDADYNQPLFGWMIVMAEMIFCIRDPYVTLAYSANRFKDFTRTAYFEASLNIVLSVIFVAKYGLIGVAAGTLISMGYRTIMQIGYLHKHILHKSILGLFKNLIGFSAGTLVVIVCSGNLINIGTLSFTGWFQFAFKNAVFAFIVFSILAYLLYRLDEKSY
ncbi:MAG: virulence factor MviN [Lachnospiraceae bacterium]|jgi:O-antigen/teichoic acid export membrane protein|nr:virulence factor MviN [Lachnospiraceae bacterium]